LSFFPLHPSVDADMSIFVLSQSILQAQPPLLRIEDGKVTTLEDSVELFKYVFLMLISFSIYEIRQQWSS
jgi:hypothetical protein